jgi:omega-6 fatty acid desaturase (delta-12 desaturase)
MREVESIQRYKATYAAAAVDFATHCLAMTATVYLVRSYRQSLVSALTVPLLSLMLARTFVVYHDCGHGSYTPSKPLNTILAHALSVFVFTDPNWTQKHALHHRTNGHLHNMDGGDFNEVIFTTVEQLKRYTPTSLFLFKIVYHPLGRFTLLPFLYFFIYQRFRLANYSAVTTLVHNASLFLFGRLLISYGILWHYAAGIQLFGMIAFFLFYNQHTFNPAYVVSESWNMRKGAMEGSSHILIPWPLTFFFNGIQYHHVHHANSKIPGYNLRMYHEEHRFEVTTLSLRQCFENVWLISFDEERGRYVTLEEIDFDKKKTT